MDRTTSTRPLAPTPGMPARFERLRFMSADAGAAGTPGPAPTPASVAPLFQAPPAPAPAPAAPAAAPAPAEPAPATDENGLPNDPALLKAEIAKLRRENGSERTNAKATAAEEARTALVRALAPVLGLEDAIVEDADPTKLIAAAETQAEEARAQARATAVELEVYRTATQHGANAAALTDSRAFLAKVAHLDPSGEDFTAQVVAAAKAAATENPSLKAVQVTGPSTVEHTGGTGERTTKPATLEDAIARRMP